MEHATVLRWLQKQEDDEDKDRSSKAADREFQAAGPQGHKQQSCVIRNVTTVLSVGSSGYHVKTNVDRSWKLGLRKTGFFRFLNKKPSCC